MCRIVGLFEETGTVCSLQGYREVPLKKLSAQDEISMITTIVENPATYLHELKSILQSTSVPPVYANFYTSVASHTKN